MMSSSSIRRLLIYYWYNCRWSRIVAVTVAAGLVYLIFSLLRPANIGDEISQKSGIIKSRFGAARYKVEKEPEKMDESAIKKTLWSLVDTRPTQCRGPTYEFTRLDATSDITVSIVLSFHGVEFYNVKLTLAAIVEHTPYDLYVEIILLDDGTGDNRVRRDIATFLHDPKLNKVRVFRSESFDGQAASWFKASAAAVGSVLVFVDTSVVVNHGWLQPLIAKLVDNPSFVVVPHVDNILDDDRFFRTDDWLVNVMTWTLSTVYYEELSQHSGGYDTLRTPVARGDVLAVHRSFLESIGGFDDKLRPDSGPGVVATEFSLRTWMCGGEVRVATCSRVAARNSLRERRVSEPSNFRHVVELWLDEYRSTAYFQSGVDNELSQSERQAVDDRRTFVQKTITRPCQKFAWYLRNIAMQIVAPSEAMRLFGKLGAKTMYCMRASESGDVDMTLCRQFMYEPASLFELSATGALFRGDRCLEGGKDGHVTWVTCSEGNSRQRWQLTDDGRLTVDAESGRCLTHLSQRDMSMDLSHLPRLVTCSTRDDDVRRQTWSFIEY